ncbi:ABC transporter ATP-binding protein [bacterium]|nr:ABC transporter ATP-binding protein [bacterium]
MEKGGRELECEGVFKAYRNGGEESPVLSGVGMAVGAGEWVSISGPSGSGKTTLLHMLAGLLPPDRGSVKWGGSDLYGMREPGRSARRAREAGMIFQFHHLLADLTVEENVRLSIDLANRSPGFPGVSGLIERLGLAALRHRRIEKLSGGERQRVAVARALAHGPRIIFADEPTGNLDERASEELLDLFEGIARSEGTTIVMVTHNPAVSARADRRFELRGGKLVEDGREKGREGERERGK